MLRQKTDVTLTSWVRDESRSNDFRRHVCLHPWRKIAPYGDGLTQNKGATATAELASKQWSMSFSSAPYFRIMKDAWLIDTPAAHKAVRLPGEWSTYLNARLASVILHG